jgi:hypothetical protein
VFELEPSCSSWSPRVARSRQENQDQAAWSSWTVLHLPRPAISEKQPPRRASWSPRLARVTLEATASTQLPSQPNLQWLRPNVRLSSLPTCQFLWMSWHDNNPRLMRAWHKFGCLVKWLGTSGVNQRGHCPCMPDPDPTLSNPAFTGWSSKTLCATEG